MKFLLDAQLPPSLKQVFVANGYDCIHTIDLELGNATPDTTINKLSVLDRRVLITKDTDFYDSFILKKEPYKLIFVKMGNASRKDIIQVFESRFTEIIERITVEDMIVLRKEA